MPGDRSSEVAGYLHPSYARSLAEFGEPRELLDSRGWILERRIPGSDRRDGMGCYPVFTCSDWSLLCQDVEALAPELVSLTLVTDPFADEAPDALRGCFDRVEPFKQHYVVDLSRPAVGRSTRHHRYYARWALRQGVMVEKCDDPLCFLDDWARLYEVLARRHGLGGIKRFSRDSFRQQLAVPGVAMFRATYRQQTVAAHIWYLQDGHAHSHLQATDRTGYGMRAAYALYAEALEWLAGHCSQAAIGAAAGSVTDRDDGLAQFKRGWSTGTKPTFLCTRVLDRDAYAGLSGSASESGYFPAYRSGELL